MLDIIKSAKNFSHINNASFYFVYLQDPNRFYYNNFDNTEYFQMRDFLKKNNINLIDLMDDYNNLKDPKKYYLLECIGIFQSLVIILFSRKIYERVMIKNS